MQVFRLFMILLAKNYAGTHADELMAYLKKEGWQTEQKLLPL